MQQVRYDLLQESDAMVVVSTKYMVYFVAPNAASCIAGTKNDPNFRAREPWLYSKPVETRKNERTEERNEWIANNITLNMLKYFTRSSKKKGHNEIWIVFPWLCIAGCTSGRQGGRANRLLAAQPSAVQELRSALPHIITWNMSMVSLLKIYFNNFGNLYLGIYIINKPLCELIIWKTWNLDQHLLHCANFVFIPWTLVKCILSGEFLG